MVGMNQSFFAYSYAWALDSMKPSDFVWFAQGTSKGSHHWQFWHWMTQSLELQRWSGLFGRLQYFMIGLRCRSWAAARASYRCEHGSCVATCRHSWAYSCFACWQWGNSTSWSSFGSWSHAWPNRSRWSTVPLFAEVFAYAWNHQCLAKLEPPTKN